MPQSVRSAVPEPAIRAGASAAAPSAASPRALAISELTAIAMATNVVIMAVLGVLLRNQSGALVIWLGVLYFCVVALVFFVARVLRRDRHAAGAIPPARRAVTYTILAALPWVGLIIGFYPAAGAGEQMVIGSIVTGLVAAGAFVLSPYPAAARIYSFMLVAAAIAALLVNPTPAHLALVFCLSTLAAFVHLGIGLHARAYVGQASDCARLARERDALRHHLDGLKDRAAGWWFETTPAGALSGVSPRLAETLGAEPDALRAAGLAYLLPSTSSGAAGALRQVAAGEPFDDRVVMVEIAGEPRFWSLVARPAVTGAGLLVEIADVTEQRRVEARLARMARYDALTGLANRALFRADLDRAFEERGDGNFAVLLVNLAEFKAATAHVGRDAGDEILKTAAGRLVTIAGEGTRVARLGTEEFALLQCTDGHPAAASALASRIVAEFARPFAVAGTALSIGALVGVALAPADGRDAGTLLRAADLAQLKARAHGANGWCFFEAGMDAAAAARRTLEADLRRAVENDELFVHYQPISDADSGEVTGCEALIRWTNRDLGPVSPAVFIPLAEEIGLIDRIGEAVLRSATAEAASWRHPVRVAVNLSPLQFRNQRLLASVVNALAESGLPAHRLELEVTESVLLDADDRTAHLLAALRELGVKIALDDFGTGYSSLSYLARFPFDKIKIDRSFIRDVDIRHESAAIVRTITDLARALGMRTTAEGVETQGQLAHLRANGCTEIQGYLLGRPMAPAQLAEHLARPLARIA